MSFAVLVKPKDSNALEEHQHMYLFVYKTVHKNGRYYLGRHETDNLDDGYLGSGTWVKSIKDKSTLSREIIAEAISFDELKKLEEYYISLHWDDPLCMNLKKASVGWTSEDSMRLNEDRVNNGTHNLLKRADGSSASSDRVKDGTHHFLTRPDGTSFSLDRVKNGTHHFLTRPDGTSFSLDRVNNGTNPFQRRPDGTSLAYDRVNNGTNPFQRRPDGTSLAYDRVNNGTHNFLTRPDGTSLGSEISKKRAENGTHNFLTRSDGTNINTDRVKNGTHHFLKRTDGTSIGRENAKKRVENGTHNLVGNATCRNKDGIVKNIPKEEYHSQTGPIENWEWASVASKEGKRRKLLKKN